MSFSAINLIPRDHVRTPIDSQEYHAIDSEHEKQSLPRDLFISAGRYQPLVLKTLPGGY